MNEINLSDLLSSTALQIGAGGLFAIFILRMVFEFMRGGEKDDKSLAMVLSKLSESIQKQTEFLNDLKTQMVLNTEIMRRQTDDIKELKNNTQASYKQL
jgi:hypothetical protein